MQNQGNPGRRVQHQETELERHFRTDSQGEGSADNQARENVEALRPANAGQVYQNTDELGDEEARPTNRNEMDDHSGLRNDQLTQIDEDDDEVTIEERRNSSKNHDRPEGEGAFPQDEPDASDHTR